MEAPGSLGRKALLVFRASLPRGIVAAPSLEVLKARLGGALCKLIEWKMYLTVAVGLEIDGL